LDSKETLYDQTPFQSEEETNRYSRQSILRSEAMYGEGFQSPGGNKAIEEFCSKLDMKKGMKILDIGSGLGGTAFYFSETYSATVLGLDLSQEMVDISRERKEKRGLPNITFQQEDIRTTVLLKETFDLVWTRDCILYIPEKLTVWEKVYSSLKPGGQLFITDFCLGDGPFSELFTAYLDSCKYHLKNLENYGLELEIAGFRDIRVENHTKAFIDSLQDELSNLKTNHDQFLQEFTEEDYDYLVNRWNKKILFCEQNNLTWGLFIATK